MKLKNTILAIIGGATVSAALAVNVHITTEDHSQVGAAIVHQPVGIRPAGGTSNHSWCTPYTPKSSNAAAHPFRSQCLL